MVRTSAAAKKAAEKAERLAPGELVIRVQATEATLERLWALMMFAEAPFKMEKIETGPLPWEEPKEQPAAPEIDLDYETIRRAVVRQLEAFVILRERAAVVKLLAKHGAKKLTDLTATSLLGLYNELVALGYE